MGCLATLIISPCVTPALVGVLGYIGQTGDIFFGGLSLFMLGLGMGLPLLAVGIAGNRLLPKTGAWMQTLEYIFGVIFLGLAIWMLSRVIPPPISLALWGLLAVVSAIYLGALRGTIPEGFQASGKAPAQASSGAYKTYVSSEASGQHSQNLKDDGYIPSGGWYKLWQGLGYAALVYGILLLIGAAKGNVDPLQPLADPAEAFSSAAMPTTLKTVAQLQAILAKTPLEKPVLLDFYANWCVSCKMMEQRIHTDPAIQQQLKQFLWLKADITNNDTEDQQLLHYLNLIAPPTFLIFDRQGQLRPELTRLGSMDADTFTQYLLDGQKI